MNKTVTVNIGGIVFHIEEHAYDKMKRYLDAIRGYFTSSEGRDEIIQDIESRIAEMFNERIGTSRQVVTEEDVEYVIDKLGRPEQVAGEDDEQKNASQGQTYSSDRNYRRLYRDPDDQVVAGVCSGFSYYVGIDPIWVRGAFAVSFFIFGTGLLLYILLAIIIPKAKTTSEKLEMKGEPVNINSIKRSIEEDIDDIKSRLKSDKKTGYVRRNQGTVSRFFSGLGEIIISAIKFFFKLIAILLMIVIFILLVGLLIGTLSVAGVINVGTIPIAFTDLLLSPGQRWMVILSAILLLGVPLIMLLLKLVKMLFKVEMENKYLSIGAGVLWGLGFVVGSFTLASISKDYKAKEYNRTTIPIAQPKNNTLYLEVLNPGSYREGNYYDNDWEFNGEWSSYELNDTMHVSNVKLDIVKSDDGEFKLQRIVSARGKDRKTALSNTRTIDYAIVQEDSVLKVSRNFSIKKNEKFRGQKIQLVLKVPVGKSVHLSESTDDVIYDIKNVTDTWDYDMVGKTWTMTEKGLECINCNLEDSDNDDVHIRINGKEIDIDEDDLDSLNLNDKDVKIRIDENGVLIDAKNKR